MDSSIFAFVKQRKASSSSQANVLAEEEIEVGADDPEITSGVSSPVTQ